jgi:YggT family protein
MSFIHTLIAIYIWILIIAALLSWLPTTNSQGALVTAKRILATLTEPVLRPLRSILPRPQFGGVGIDLSVLVAVIGLEIINVII